MRNFSTHAPELLKTNYFGKWMMNCKACAIAPSNINICNIKSILSIFHLSKKINERQFQHRGLHLHRAFSCHDALSMKNFLLSAPLISSFWIFGVTSNSRFPIEQPNQT
ncbi:hypothetical protein Msip34_1671 [Methylovorus glucosotrophus SIP3-4]|uniref:Uncharacterized protein n=1 Tax=Methylovorus glucosotrophus (strain SIP3-4) TaxID=582744 RepID=C6XEE1_METGS|nr:hypothetical protein Msip34_1671 [Methylovorus glucosotrophus SIP3-4]